MHFLASVSVASSILALTSALPTLNQRAVDFCPGQLFYSIGGCTSGFSGCVSYEKGDETCGGTKRFFNDCSAGSGLGSFFSCANGFKGCSTNPRICDVKTTGPVDQSSNTPSNNPTPAPGTCKQGEGNWYVCANGFKGCSTNPRICDPVTKPTAPTLSTGSGADCPSGTSFFVCASNGFRGCSANPKICDTPSTPSEPSQPSNPVTPAPKTPTCPKDTWYVRSNDCSSGFIGCTSSELAKGKDICGGEKRFWGSCPPNHGNYYNCANGFVGCTTDVGVCDKKSV